MILKKKNSNTDIFPYHETFFIVFTFYYNNNIKTSLKSSKIVNKS